MSYSKSEFRDKIRSSMKIDLNGRIWGDTELDDFIDQSHEKAQSDVFYDGHDNEDQSYQFDTIPGTLEYALPVRAMAIESVKISGLPITGRTKKYLEDHYNLSQSGSPNYYYVSGGYIGFNVTPSSGQTVDILYRGSVAPPTESTGSSLDDSLNQAIILRCKYLCWQNSTGNEKRRDDALAEYESEIEEQAYREAIRQTNSVY